MTGEGLTDPWEAASGYGRTFFSRNLQFTLAASDFVGLVGLDGTGKTTLLRGHLGLIRPQSGERRIDLPEPGAHVVFGLVPQDQAVDP